MSVEYVKSEKGKSKLSLDGFLFVKDKQLANKIYWKCENFQKTKCKARIITDGINTKCTKEHNHGGDAASVEVAKIMEDIRNAAITTRDTPQFIISNHVHKISSSSVNKFPEIKTVKRTIRNIRNRNEIHSLPASKEDMVLPDEYKQTMRGEPFLLFDSGPIPSRILIFGTANSLRLLGATRHWYMDGTFKTVPHLFCQLYTIHGLKENVSIPLLYILLPDKTKETYVRMLTEIKNLKPSLNPSTIMSDFENAVISAISIVFPNCLNRGCFFHFCQCVYRKIQNQGLKQRYDSDPEFALNIRMLNALAFVPTEYVIEAFESLCDNNLLPLEAQGVIDYFEDTWIGRPNRRNQRRDPIFSHSMWNCYNAVQNDLPKTNNSVEGWHRAFESQLSASHPSIWKFLDALKREQNLNEVKIEQYVAGAVPVQPRKKYKESGARLIRLLTEFNPLNLNEYLRGIAYNFVY